MKFLNARSVSLLLLFVYGPVYGNESGRFARPSFEVFALHIGAFEEAYK